MKELTTQEEIQQCEKVLYETDTLNGHIAQKVNSGMFVPLIFISIIVVIALIASIFERREK